MENFETIFLLEFTKELIKNSNPEEFAKLREIERKSEKKKEVQFLLKKIDTKKREEGIKRQIYLREKIGPTITTKIRKSLKNNSRPGVRSIIKNTAQKIGMKLKKPIMQRQTISKPIVPIFISEPNFPQRLRDLRPTPSTKIIDLGKLSKILNDPMVKQLECNGPDLPIIAKTNSTRQTKITLTKEEINTIIANFSKESKIPVEEGVFRAAVGKFEIMAIVSNIIDTKFIIKKIVQNNFLINRQPMLRRQ